MISQNIGLRTAEVLPNQYIDNILEQLQNLIAIYTNNRFNLKLIDTDLEFKAIEFCVIMDSERVLINILDIDTKNYPTE